MAWIAEACLCSVETDLPINPVQKEPGIVSGRRRPADIDVDRAGMREANRAAWRLEATRRDPTVVTERVIDLRDPSPADVGARHAMNHPPVCHNFEALERSRAERFDADPHLASTPASELRPRRLAVRREEQHRPVGGEAPAALQRLKPGRVRERRFHVHVDAVVTHGEAFTPEALPADTGSLNPQLRRR